MTTMHGRALLHLAPVLGALTLGAAGGLLLPVETWSRLTVLAYVVLLASVGLAFSPTLGLPRRSAAAIAGTGALTAGSLLQLGLTTAAFCCALTGWRDLAYALLALWIGTVLAMLLYAHAAGAAVQRPGSAAGEDHPGFAWKLQLALVRDGCGEPLLRHALDELLDAVACAPRRAAGEDAEISRLVQRLLQLDEQADRAELLAVVQRIGRLLRERRSGVLAPVVR